MKFCFNNTSQFFIDEKHSTRINNSWMLSVPNNESNMFFKKDKKFYFEIIFNNIIKDK